MFGNLFNQKKPQQDASSNSQPVPPVPAQQTTSTSTTQLSVAGLGGIFPTTIEKTTDQKTTSVVGSSMEPSRRQDLSALSHLDARAGKILAQAQQETMRIRQPLIEPEQILFGLLFDEQIFKLLEQFSVDGAKLSRELQSKEVIGMFAGQPTLSDASKRIFEQAYRNAQARESSFITPEDLLLEMFSDGQTTAPVLQAQGVNKEQVQEKLSKLPSFVSTGKKSVIERYGVDLTAKARDGELDPVAGRDKEIERLTHILLRRTKNNPIVIGEAGVGKTAIIEGLAQKIAAGDAPKDLLNRRIIQLDVAALVAGASHRGEFEERLKGVINEAMASAGEIMLFIDEIHILMGAGDNDEGMNASNIIKPHLARGQLQIIGATTTSEYRKNFEKDKAFERRFQPIIAEEPDEENAVAMMKVLKPKYEKFHNVVIDDDTLVQAVKLSKKYIGERYLPDKAVDLLDEASAEVKLAVSSGKRQDNGVKKSDIEKIVSTWTGIPITKLTEDEGEKLLKLEDLVHKRLIDQEEAVVAVSEAVRRGRIGLAAANRPIASFIFLGPTGVGKTELAKTLAEILFGRDDAMIRLDMSEYMEKHEVAKLIGAPPGYVGYEEGGQLTEAVRAKPYSIVLFDEIEKAHPDVFNILLQLLEDGRLTDNKGNTISFKNTIVVCTSNIGSGTIQEYLSKKNAPKMAPGETVSPMQQSSQGHDPFRPAADAQQPTVDQPQTSEAFNKQFKELTDLVTEELRKFFRPELLNRFDDVVIFKPLRMEHMGKIAKLGIEKTGKLLKDQGFAVEITDKAVAQLAKEGYDPVYGARPLRRLIQTSIENPIALQIISKTFIAGDTILIDYDEAQAKFTFLKGTPQVAQPDGTTPPDGTQPTSTDGTSTTPGSPPIQSGPVDPSAGGTAIATPQDPNAAPQQAEGIPDQSLQQPQPPQELPANGVITNPVDPVRSAYENMLQSYMSQVNANQNAGGIISQPPQKQSPPTPPPPGGNATMSVGSTHNS